MITSLTSITSELAKVQYLKDKAEDWEKAEKAKKSAKNETSMRLLWDFLQQNTKSIIYYIHLLINVLQIF